MLQNDLQQLGFSDKEIEVYLALLKRGKATPTDLAKATKINRTTVYSLSKSLTEKGVIAEDMGGKTLYLTALPPERLLDPLKKEQAGLETKKKTIQSAIQELSLLRNNTQYSIPKIRFVEEGDLENHLYKQSSLWIENNLKHDRTWWGFQDHSLVEQYEVWLEWIWQEYPHVFVKLLSNQSQIEKVVQKKLPLERQIKFWRKASDFTATTWIVGDFLIMIITRQRPFYLVEIHDPVLAHNQRQVFKNLWEEVR